MTREQAKQNLISIGVAEPTDEQISNYLNQVNGETKKEKDRADGYKAKADTADDLQKQLDDLQAGNLTELEKANKALETANQQIAKLQKDNAVRDLREQAMSDFGITAEQAKTVVKDDGGFDTAVLGKIMSDKEANAIAEYEKKNLEGTPNPNNGGGGANPDNQKTDDVLNAEKITFGNPATSAEAQNHYVI